MNFAFTEEQEELRKTVRSFLENKSSEAAVREQMETEGGVDAAVWSQMGDQMGLQGLAIPEEFGGSGFTFIELGIVLEEMGRALLCAPYFSSVVLAANALLHSGDDVAKAAHLPGIASGETIATLGRTTNTREGISRERAHVHFELDLIINERFPEWYRKTFPTQRNDHGGWNGQNLLGLDPRLVLLEQQRLGAKFDLAVFVRQSTELCRVFVRDTNFSWLRRYPALIRPNPRVEKEGKVGYELALNFNGLPFEAIPRAASEVTGQATFLLLSVNAAEQQKNPARRLVSKDRRGQWQLASQGLRLLELLTY